MESVTEFIEKMVDISFVKSSDCYGHYPFQLFCENSNGSIEINALALGGEVVLCFKKFAKYKSSGAVRIYMSLDFPGCGDIENDFVAIMSFENDELSVVAIPYESDGTVLPIIESCNQLDLVKKHLLSFC